MEAPKYAGVRLTCDCGNKREIPFTGIYDELTCPACGEVSKFDAKKIAEIEAGFGHALKEAAKRRDAGDKAPRGEFDMHKKRID
jgi:hypothetical protein